jgi:hypothetical protein
VWDPDAPLTDGHDPVSAVIEVDAVCRHAVMIRATFHRIPGVCANRGRRARHNQSNQRQND